MIPAVAGSREGETISGKYLLEQRIGSGGMGEVYRARNIAIDRVVAIKFLLPQHAGDPNALRRFMREANTAAKVRHPNVVDVLDVDKDAQGVPYIVQDCLRGQDLEAFVESKGGQLSPMEALVVLRPIASALALAHDQGVVHRDLKPANVLLAIEHGQCIPKLVDFGISVVKQGDKTVTGTITGTPAYMSPEQIKAPEEVGPASDVWSFAVMLYELLAGRLPFDGPTFPALAIEIAERDAPPIESLVPNIPSDLAAIIAQCLQKSPKARFATGTALLGALDNVMAQRPSEEVERPSQVFRVPGTFSAPHSATFDQPGGPEFAPPVSAAVPELGLPRARASKAQMPAAVSPVPNTVAGTGAAEHTIPDLGVPSRRVSSAQMPAARPSTQMATAAQAPAAMAARAQVQAPAAHTAPMAKAPAVGPSGPAHGIAMPTFDDDDFDMALERGGGGPASSPMMPAPTSGRMSPTPGRMSPTPGSSPRLQLDADRASRAAQFQAPTRPSGPGSARTYTAPEETAGAKAVRVLVLVLSFVLGAAPLLRFVHRGRGLSLEQAWPAAVNGTTPFAPGLVSLGALAAAIAFGYFGFASIRSWGFRISAVGSVLVSMLMIIATFATTTPSEVPQPAEVVFLVPYVLPLVPAGSALAFFWLGFQQWQERKGLAPLLALLGGVCLYLMIKLSPFAAAL
jgi:serine/threonine-protein kinase